jgi:hypothetical protein
MTDPLIIIHAGFHKTGTTTTQDSLAAHRPALAEAGWKVEVLANNPRLAAAGLAARDYSNRPDAASLTVLEGALTEWADGLEPTVERGFLVSTEDLCGRMPGHGPMTYGSTARIAAAVAEALEARFGGRLDLHFLYTTRAAEPWLRSIHWQLSKHNRMWLGLEAYVNRFGAAADLANVIEEVRAAQRWPVHAAALEDLAQRRLGPVEALYDIAGLPDTLRNRLAPLPPANTRGALDLAAVFVALNRTEMPLELRAQMKAALRELAATAASRKP